MNGVKIFMKSYENSYNSDPIHVNSNDSFPKKLRYHKAYKNSNTTLQKLRPRCELILCFLIIANHIRVIEYLDYIG